ncbi:MAG: site-2 protease family protein [Pirellulales bacterium]
MDQQDFNRDGTDDHPPSRIDVMVPPEPPPPPPSERGRRVLMPAVLYLLTIGSTFWCGYSSGRFTDAAGNVHSALEQGLYYCVGLMAILTAHELGHFFQAVRYGVPASLPYFLPMPGISPIGTMGAVIAMRPHSGDRKSLFDIGISGPIAGLIPALACSVWGVQQSAVVNMAQLPGASSLGEPLVFKWLVLWLKGPLPEGHDIILHPVAFAGWVGLLITSLNLWPIGQLDGGHILYTLLRRHAKPVATLFLLGAIVAIAFGYPTWSAFVILLCLMGPEHPPTADDSVPLGWPRIILGWLMLAFLPIGFTPSPFQF